MYKEYADTPEGRALEALEHPDGEEYSGALDSDRQVLLDNGWDQDEVENRFGKFHQYRKGQN